MRPLMQAVVPCKFRTAKQLVSHNIHSSTYNYKYTFSVEIVPVCKVNAVKSCSCASKSDFVRVPKRIRFHPM